MSIELANKIVNDDSIPVRRLRSNQVAVITSWDCGAYAGKIIKRNGSALFAITGSAWWSVIPFEDSCRVRVLSNGIMMKIVDNN